MWSGPRNISTALMRAWENRTDAVVYDEPFYAHYLAQTGLPHPGADEVIAHHESDWQLVAQEITGPIPTGATIYYQKHMSHHLMPDMMSDWLWDLRHCFLIRDPREMLLSLSKVLPDPMLEDTGLPQQLDLFERVRAHTGVVPPVLDAKDVLMDPRGTLTTLCTRLGTHFDEAMLAWPAGTRASDGVWAKHWYSQVERSTGFQTYRPREGELSPALQAMHGECTRCYDALYEHRLRAD